MTDREFTERPCAECGELTYNEKFCRDCNLERLMSMMECSGCRRMRYRRVEPGDVASEIAVGLGEYLWGERCECDPAKVPSVFGAKQ